MNYSENQTYGRKIIRNKKPSSYYTRLYISWGVCSLIGFIIGAVIVSGINFFTDAASKDEVTKSEAVVVESPTYGTIDDKVFISEVSLDWDNGTLNDFIPLDVPMDEEMQQFIHNLSYVYNIEFPFIMAMIECESSFNSNVISRTDDYGLMQINRINHEWLTEQLGVTNFLDPLQNII